MAINEMSGVVKELHGIVTSMNSALASLNVGLATQAADMSWVKERLNKLPCEAAMTRISANDRRLAVVENQQVRRNGIAAGLGAFAGAVVMLIKYLAGKL